MTYIALLILSVICIIQGKNIDGNRFGDGGSYRYPPPRFDGPFDDRFPPGPPPGGGYFPGPGRNACPTSPPVICNCNCGGSGTSKGQEGDGSLPPTNPSGSDDSRGNGGDSPQGNNGNGNNDGGNRNDGTNENDEDSGYNVNRENNDQRGSELSQINTGNGGPRGNRGFNQPYSDSRVNSSPRGNRENIGLQRSGKLQEYEKNGENSRYDGDPRGTEERFT